MGRGLGFQVHGHSLVGEDGQPARDDEQVSSTAIRRALHHGRLDSANRMLGRPHEMRGPVVHGDGRGRELGFPTANVAITETMLMPSEGIYAGHLVRERNGERLPAAIFAGDLYGEPVRVQFEHRIRGDRRFDSVEELAAQLSRDCDEARRLLLR
jgi:riboflavin kinase/FMN adenylyltransferase